MMDAIPYVPYYLVLTFTVYRRTGTNYRGVYRGQPEDDFWARDSPPPEDMEAALTSQDDWGRFPSKAAALRLRDTATRYGINCEVIRCQLIETADPTKGEAQETLLGFEVASPTSFHSMIVEYQLFDPFARKDPLRHLEEGLRTVECVGRYFGRLLNQHRLFSTPEDALDFCAVYEEIAKDSPHLVEQYEPDVCVLEIRGIQD